MQTWTCEYGTVSLSFGTLSVAAGGAELRGWAGRPGFSWPCSTLARYDRVAVEVDRDSGDMVDLVVYLPGERWAEDSDDVDIDGSELTAWLDDCLAGTPFATLARGAVA